MLGNFDPIDQKLVTVKWLKILGLFDATRLSETSSTNYRLAVALGVQVLQHLHPVWMSDALAVSERKAHPKNCHFQRVNPFDKETIIEYVGVLFARWVCGS
ncbi:hypothetical protein DAPPUDRAFT_280325 [Daphnia pulex]|uniref:Uncharacterized protein n=1 Tax=Daphnia pulex TaxID=6669 RepID=E9I7V3_DAPPU|nr:hypothetical protein DAPPUDRAFT_280325 [Daphnia pulex]|eukprot:EFX59927.1 hypothetical protein DAPPUDRAFT_280325 [Daphnia pulex]